MNFNPFATCGIVLIAVLAIMICYVFNVEPLKCIGTLGLIAIAIYVVNVGELSYQIKVSIFFLFLLCASFITGAQNVLTHLETASKLKAVKDLIETIISYK